MAAKCFKISRISFEKSYGKCFKSIKCLLLTIYAYYGLNSVEG
jgi:hypothetical protein